MQIRIEFGSTEPPEGRTWREGHHDWLPFVGWLELISAIERHLDAGKRPLPNLPNVREVEHRQPEGMQ